MKQPRKKRPEDYSIMAFRLDENTKIELYKAIDEAHRRMNLKRGSEQKVIRKNQIIIEALRLGLKQLKRNY